MNREQQEKHLEYIFSKMREIMLKKGNDYATQDRLSNFKLAGNICGISPEVQCLSLIATKVARLSVLLHSQNEPNNESISDSIIDLINYAALLDMLLSDKEENRKIQSLKERIQETTKQYWDQASSTGKVDNQYFDHQIYRALNKWDESVCDVCHGIGKTTASSKKTEDCFKCQGTGVI